MKRISKRIAQTAWLALVAVGTVFALTAARAHGFEPYGAAK